MNHKDKKNIFYIFLICAGLYSVYEFSVCLYTGGVFGVPLDDTWIHFRFAENFAKSFTFAFNPGEPTSGTTSPLWVVILAGMSYVSGNYVLNSVFLSCVFHFLCVVMVYLIVVRMFLFQVKNEMLGYPLAGQQVQHDKYLGILVTPDGTKREITDGTRMPALLASVFVVLTGRFLWAGLSGMETTCYTFLILAGVYAHIRDLKNHRISFVPAVLFGLAETARPEAMLFFGLYLVDCGLWIWSCRVSVPTYRFTSFIRNLRQEHGNEEESVPAQERRNEKNIIRLVISVLIFSVIVVPYFVFSKVTSGHYLPNTFSGQGGGLNLILNFKYLKINLIFFFRDNPIIAILYLSSIVYYFANFKKFLGKYKYLNLIFLWLIFHPLVSSVLIPNWRHHGRYMIPLIPFISITSIFMLSKILYFMKKPDIGDKYKFFISPIFRKLVIGAILFFFLPYLWVFAIALAKNTDNINKQQVKLGYWVKENLAKSEVIAVNDIGAIAFISKNRIVDMVGLVSPDMLEVISDKKRDNSDAVFSLLKKNNVNYIIIYDHWYPDFLNRFKKKLKKVHSAYLEENTICGGFEMTVYRINYNTE